MEKLVSVHSGSKTNLRQGPARVVHTTLIGRNGLGFRLMSLLHPHKKLSGKGSERAKIGEWVCEACHGTTQLWGKKLVREMKLCPACRKQVLVYDQRQGLSQFPAREEAEKT